MRLSAITLEIVCFANRAKLPIGERFAHLVFFKLAPPSEPYRGKYQGQTAITPAILDMPPDGL